MEISRVPCGVVGLHFAHCIAVYPVNSVSSALASFRSCIEAPAGIDTVFSRTVERKYWQTPE